MEQTQEVSVQDDGALYQLETARQALATVKTLPELKAIRDKANALSQYAKQRQYSLDIQNSAAEIRLEAERRMGALLKEMRKDQGGRPQKKTGSIVEPVLTAPPTLDELGITKKQSHRWQKAAALPDDAFQTYIADTRAKGEELTSAAVLRQAKPYLPASRPRVQRWCIEDDVEAFFDLWDRLRPRWQTPTDKARICGALRGLMVNLDDETHEEEHTA